MTKENRFEGLMGAVRGKKATQSSKPGNDSDLKSEGNSKHLDVQTSKHSNIQTSKTKKPTQNQPNTEQASDADEKTFPDKSPSSDAETSKHLDAQTSKSSKLSSTSKHSNIQTSKTKKSTQNQFHTEQTSDAAEQSYPDVSDKINVQTSKHLDVQPQLAKSVNPDYIRTTVYLPKKLHRKLKAIAVSEEKNMSGIVEELIETWLKSKN